MKLIFKAGWVVEVMLIRVQKRELLVMNEMASF